MSIKAASSWSNWMQSVNSASKCKSIINAYGMFIWVTVTNWDVLKDREQQCIQKSDIRSE